MPGDFCSTSVSSYEEEVGLIPLLIPKHQGYLLVINTVALLSTIIPACIITTT